MKDYLLLLCSIWCRKCSVDRSHASCPYICTMHTYMPITSAFLSQANEAYPNLTRQLEVVIIEVCMFQALRPRSNPWRVHEAKYLTSTNWSYGQAGFHIRQAGFQLSSANYLNKKVLIFAELGHMQFFKLLT